MQRKLLAALGAVVALVCVAAVSPALAGVTSNYFDRRSPLRYETLTYSFSATADASGNVVGVCPAGGAYVRDVIYGQAAAGVGGLKWTATPKKNATALVTTAGGFTLAAGANKATNASGRPVTLTNPTGGTRPVLEAAAALTCTGGEVFYVDLDVEHVHATGTATLGESLAAAEKVTFESHDFVAKAKYASNIVTCAAVQAGDTVTLDGVEFLGTTAGATLGADEFDVGTGGTANADCAASLADAINANTTVTASASATDAAVTITADTAGDAGNDITLTTSEGTRLAITTAGGKLAGAYDPAADEWPVEATTTLSAAALANALNTSATSGVDGVITATSSGGTVTVTAVTDGTDGNSLTWAKTGDNITVSGSGTLTGGTNYSTAVTGSVQIVLEPKY